MEVLGDLMIRIKALVEVGLAVAVEIIENNDLVATTDIDAVVNNLYSERLEEATGLSITAPGFTAICSAVYASCSGPVTAEALSGGFGDGLGPNADYVNKVIEANVRKTVADLRSRSEVLAGLEKEGKIKIVGGIYSLHTGRVTLLD